METQIKEEARGTSLYFESSGQEDLASLSLVEKYDRFLQNDQSDADSDVDFLPDETVLKEEYAQLRSEPANYTYAKKNSRLSTGLPGRYRSIDSNLSVVVDEEPRNGTPCQVSGDTKSDLISLNELIEKLESIRKSGPEGNSIFCTESELEAIQERYSEILDFIHERSSTFEKTSSSKDLTAHQTEEQSREISDTSNGQEEKSDDLKLLDAKMEAVRLARDGFYEVEQQVREQIEQLELVERYKMESVG